MRLFLLIMLSVYIKPSFCEDACSNFKTCGTCIGFAKDTCVWCSGPKIDIAKRCQPKTFLLKEGNKDWCKGFIYDPKQERPDIVDTPFRSAKGNASAVQFRPQHMTVKLRPGHELKFSMSFKHSDDFPLDVYYLMDYSYTMNKHVAQLRKQSEMIKTQLTAFTNNVRFGLGSYIEKSSYPFVGSEHRAYAFRNNLNLTSDMKLFDRVLSEKRSYSNYDLPEAGLDGLMQVMACDKRLGWRPNANRIIILCTDAPYHSAGDGKAVLAYRPNDMKCHLNQSDYYSDSLKYDYPSVSQINRMAREGKFKIIFATLDKAKVVYEILASQIYEAKVALLKESQIVNIIKEAYLASIRYVTMQYQFPPYVQLTLDPDCSRPGYDACRIGHKKTFTMNAILKVTSCPQNPSAYRHKLEIAPIEGGLEDKLKIDLEIANCECDCEKDKTRVPNSPTCHNFGTLQCGICLCNKDKHGEFCECGGSAWNKTGLEKCKNKNDTKYCSGKGSCDGCGKCTCKFGFSGDFCEFDDNSCKKKNNRLCSGNGRCHLGGCRCHSADWTGEDCGCSTLTDNCYAPYSNEVCFGKGKCVCNECQCDKLSGKTNETYSGFFCDDCQECAGKRCKDLESYVHCNFMFNKTHCDDQFNQTSNTDVEMLNKTEINSQQWPPTAKWCTVKLDEKKSIVFIHFYNKFDKSLRIIIQKEADLEPEANIWVPVGIALGTVILIGLLTVLAWKLLVDEMDKREYEKFMNKAKSEGYNVENPLYQAASVNFCNPTYPSGGNNC